MEPSCDCVEISTTRYATASAPQSYPLQTRVAVSRLDAEDAALADQEETLLARSRTDLLVALEVEGSAPEVHDRLIDGLGYIGRICEEF
jgi:hypothetical protein